MPKPTDLTNQRFGRLVAIERLPKTGRIARWRCRCDCGREKVVQVNNLRSGVTMSCGCLAREVNSARKIDLANQRFGRLVAIESLGPRPPKANHVWRCRCDCGAVTEVTTDSLQTGRSKSCGCLNREAITVHGETGRPLHYTWSAMRQRCNSPKHTAYPHYGGRGIKVHPDWDRPRTGYLAFRDYVLAHLGPRPPGMSLDRIENDDGYRPGNIRWATPEQQNRNQRPKRKRHAQST